MLKPGTLMWHQYHAQNTSRGKHHAYRIFWKTIAELSGFCFILLAQCIGLPIFRANNQP